MLRNRLPDEQAEWPHAVMGVNLRDSLEDLQPGEAERLTNMYNDGGMRKRFGSSVLTTASLGAFRGRGGIRAYPQTATRFRMIAYSTFVSTISDTGVQGIVTGSLTSDQDVHFKAWSITDYTYVCNKSNIMGRVSAGQAYSTVTGVNIPASPTMACPFLDRLFAIQGDGVWSTNPRVDTVWSPNSSTWAVYRPAGGAGGPTAIHLHSLTGQQSTPQAQMLIFQSAAVTSLTGTDFGSDVTAATPPTGWDATLTLLSPRIGTNSPYSVVTVPALGTFWFTQDYNVAWLPFNEATPRLIGDKLFSNRADLYGINDVNASAIGQVRMIYHDRKLKLFLPVDSNAYSTIQYWLDLRDLQTAFQGENQATVAWSGPHIGQSLSALWVESESSDNDVLYGCEGNSTTGMFVYLLNDSTTYKDANGLLTADVELDYRTFYHTFGAPTYEKWIPEVRFDAIGRLQNATVTLKDLHGSLVGGLMIYKNDGSAFVTQTYGGGYKYGDGNRYGSAIGQVIGHTVVESQATSSMLGDAIQIQVAHTTGKFVLNSIIPQVKVNRTQPVA